MRRRSHERMHRSGVTFSLAAPSLASTSDSAPTRSSPSIKNAFFGPLSLSFAALAMATNAAGSAGTKSACDLRWLGNAEKASRFTRASRSTLRSFAPSPALSGTIV